jgi:hypothetical protein
MPLAVMLLCDTLECLPTMPCCDKVSTNNGASGMFLSLWLCPALQHINDIYRASWNDQAGVWFF